MKPMTRNTPNCTVRQWTEGTCTGTMKLNKHQSAND